MKKIFALPYLMLLFACESMNKQTPITLLPYPETRQEVIEENYFGTKIKDPYRWLENDTSKDVEKWVDGQNKITHHYLAQIPFREKIREELTAIWNFEKYSSPFKEGKWLYYFKNDGLQNQSVLYRQLGTNGVPQIFLDPNTLSKDGTISLASISFSKDSRYCAIGLASSGSDWNEIYVVETETNKRLSDDIRWVKFSGATWYQNGFYYSRYDEPVKGKEYTDANEYMKIYYHTIGKPQSEDVLVYEDKSNPLLYFDAIVTEDERYLLINISEGTSGSEVLIQDLSHKNKLFTLLFKGFEYNYEIIYSIGNQLLVKTDFESPKYRLVAVDPLKPQPQYWKDIIPQNEDLMQDIATGGGKLFVTYLKDASSRMYSYALDGNNKTEILLPEIGTVSGIGSKENEFETFYTFTSFTNPGEIYHYNIATGVSSLFKKTKANFDAEKFETNQVFFSSTDGEKVPMFIMHKKGIKLDGSNPTLLYGYGGFNISLTPSFSISRIAFLETGGVYVVANLRGGGEYGEDWHKAGMLNKKQQVFDDFIAAAEYLIASKYTSPEKLAIHGGSNGGLLVGACMTQRPELFKVAIPAVGVLDMLRYHKFTIGWGWAVEYGSSDNKLDFDYLIKYSPLHNVKKEVNYPATLIMTADHDDRVVPAHSFKFAAELQHKQMKNGNPILIRIDKEAGHGAGKPTAKLIEDATDMWSFVLWNLQAKLKFE